MNKRNRQRFGLVLVLVMVMTLFTPHAAVATRTVHDGHHLNIRTEPQQMWFTSVGGRPVETNWYHGHGVTFLCLEYGVSHPAPNLRYVVVDAFVKEHDRSGRPELVLGADGLPMINPNVPALANGRQPTVGEVYAMAYVLHQLNQNRGSREWAYAAQNATRAFWHDRGIFWAGNPVSFNGARFIDSTGNLTAGTVRASSPYSNHILQLAVDLYDDMTRIANSARPDLSGQNQRPSVIPGARTGNQQTFQVNSPGAPWAINRLSLDALLEAGVTPSMTQGPQGTTTLVLSGITEDLTINSFTVNAYAEAMFGNFAFMVPERSGFQIFSAMLPGTAAGIGFEVDIQPNEPEDDAPPFPRLPNARVSANKFDADPGFDGNHTTPRGDARLNARFDVFMDGQFITSFQADERGAGGWSDEFPLWTYSDLTRVTEYHDCSGYLQRVTYTAPARTIRVYEVVPAGMLSEADGQTGNQTGYREFVTQPFHATIYRTIVCISDDYGWCFGHMRNPWPANYTYNFDTLNPSHFTGLSVRNIGPANFYNRVPEGDLIVNKVINRNFDPFGNHLMVQEPMPGARFVIRLTSGGSEGQPYLRAVLVGSGDPDFSPFRNTYRVARGNYGIVMDGSTAASSFVTGPAAGNAQFLVLGIPYGSYQLTEIESNPADFFALSNFGFTIRHDRQVVQNVDLSTVSFTVANTPGEDEIIVRKVCAESGRTIPSAKMGFRIRYMGPLAGTPPHLVNEASIGRLFVNPIMVAGTEDQHIFFTDANGRLRLPFSLIMGHYQLEEIQAPDGYFLGQYLHTSSGGSGFGENSFSHQDWWTSVSIYDANGQVVNHHVRDDRLHLPYVIHRFSITQAGHGDRRDPIVIEVPNIPVKGKLDIIKTGEAIVDFTQQTTRFGTLNVPVIEQRPQSGITFDIFARSDVRMPDGVDSPLFVDRNLTPIPLNVIEDSHALTQWGNALRVETATMPDGMELSVVTERHPNSHTAMAFAELLTPTQSPNLYSLNFTNHVGAFDQNQDIHVSFEYTQDGFGLASIDLTKITSYEGTIYDVSDFPGASHFRVETGYEVMDTPADFFNRIFDNGNEVEVRYLSHPLFVRGDEPLTIVPLRFFDNPLSHTVFGNYHSFTNAAGNELYTAIWTDETRTRQVWAKHFPDAFHFSKYFLYADWQEIEPIEHDYVMFSTPISEELYLMVGVQEIDANGDPVYERYELTFRNHSNNVYPMEHLLPRFVYSTIDWSQFEGMTDGEIELILETLPAEQRYTAVIVNGSIEFVPVRMALEGNRAWVNLPCNFDDPRRDELADFTLFYQRMLDENRIIYVRTDEPDETSPQFKIFGVLEGEESLVPSTWYGEFFDRKLEGFFVTLHKTPRTDDPITLYFDGFEVFLDTTLAHGTVHITNPSNVNPVLDLDVDTQHTVDGNIDRFTIFRTQPSAMMQLHDGTTITVSYSGGWVFSEIDIPFGNEMPRLTYQGEDRPLLHREFGGEIEPSFEPHDILPINASGDRITTHLVIPVEGRAARTLVTIATQRTDTDTIRFEFADGRTMRIQSYMRDGVSRGRVEVDALTPTYRFLLGELVQTITTGMDNDTQYGREYVPGLATSKLLPLGTYIIRERAGASDSMVVEDRDYEVTLTFIDNYVPLIWGGTTVENRMAYVQLNLQKVFQTAPGADTFVPRAGAVFGVFTNESLVVERRTLLRNSLVGIFETDADGVATGTFLLPFGEFFVRELATLPGYELNTHIFPFSFQASDVDAPVRTQFTDLGVTIEYRHKDAYTTEVVVRTLRRTPALSYTVNGVVIDTTVDRTVAAGGATVIGEMTGIDHMARIVGAKGAEISIDFGDGNVVIMTPNAGGYTVHISHPDSLPVVYDLPLQNSAVVNQNASSTTIDFTLALSNIRYRAVMEASHDHNVSRPRMIVDGGFEVFRELNALAGYDRLVILNADLDDIATSIPFEVNPNNPNEIRVDMVHLGASEAISFTGSSSVISVSMTGGVMELDGSSADMRFEIDGAALSHEGIQVDGSYVSGSTVTYFNRNITIVDANSDDFVQASILGTFASGTLYFNRAPFMIFRDGETITPSASLPLDRLVPYNIVMHDGVTQAEVVLLHDNTLRITLDGRVTSNFDDYRTPALYSQGQREWIVDTDGTIIEQGAGVEVRTIDNIHFFATESRQYMRPDGFANVTRININTQDGILQDIINRLPDRPTTPDRPGNGGGNGGGYTPERERERPELERPEEEEPYEILDEEVPLDEILFGNVAFDVPETPIYDGIIPHDSVIPQTSATDNRNLYIFMLVLSLSVFAILPKRRQSKQAISFSRHMN